MVKRRRRLCLGCLIPATLAVAVITTFVCTSSAPALNLPTLGSWVQPTFSAGSEHSLAIGSDGQLWAWGNNSSSQLGDGTTANRYAPLRITTGWVTVAAGGTHSLAVRDNGSLWGWGSNTHGQVGDGTNISKRPTPTRIGMATGWVAVSAGYNHSLAIMSDGSLWAWGNNSYGQLGDGTTTNRSAPRQIGLVNDWVAVSAGSRHSLALRSDGSLWAWGRNNSGQVGDGTASDCPTPTRVGMGTSWVAVAAGGEHSLALGGGGSLWAWGDNTWGQLGNGTTTPCLAPTRIGMGTSWVAVSAGGGHSLALRSDGSLWTCGHNEWDQPGGGAIIVDLHVPTQIGTGTGWVAISAGSEHSLALGGGGSLWAWGDNTSGQLGDGSTTDRQETTEVLIDVKLPAFVAPTTTTTTSPTSTTTTLPGGTGFPDVPPGHPYHEAISHLSGAGIISGFEDGSFRPEVSVTRQQFAKMIVKTLGLPVTGAEVCPFVDVAVQMGTDPFYPSKYVAVCAERGITVGKNPSTFAPGDSITRQQLITMVARAAGLSEPPVGYEPTFFPPQFSLEEHFLNARKAAHVGLLTGLEGVGINYNFTLPAGRGECAQLLYNLSQM